MINLGNRIVNNWLRPIEDGFVLIDTGYETGFSGFQKQLALQNVDVTSIRYVFLTHAHDDHAGFLNALLEKAPDVKVIVSPKTPEGLRRGQNSFSGGCTSHLALFFCRGMKLFGKGAHRFPPIRPEFEERCVTISDGNRGALEEILGGTILETPGHTADSISLLLHDGTLFCGDAAMNGLPSLHRITIWAEDREAFLKSWQTIIAARPAKIFPGHGKPFSCDELEQNLRFVHDMKLYPLSGA